MPESPGKTLKKIREAKQLSIEEVSERIRIPKKIISAIEEDRLQEIASSFYARTFVKSYSQFLGALGEKTVKEYLDGTQKKEKPVLILKGEKVQGEWFIKYKRYIGLSILALFGVWMFFFSLLQIRKFIKYVSTKARVQIARKQEPSSKTKLPDKVTLISTTTSAKKIQGFDLEIIARVDTWVHATEDGKLLFKGILKKKQKDVWRAKKEIKLELGNAGGVVLKLNRKNLGPIGKKGQKKEIIITKDGIKQ
ncbi:helix-turn-helix domain-containing protein [Candidatus Omnitrophota bacterium]